MRYTKYPVISLAAKRGGWCRQARDGFFAPPRLQPCLGELSRSNQISSIYASQFYPCWTLAIQSDAEHDFFFALITLMTFFGTLCRFFYLGAPSLSLPSSPSRERSSQQKRVLYSAKIKMQLLHRAKRRMKARVSRRHSDFLSHPHPRIPPPLFVFVRFFSERMSDGGGGDGVQRTDASIVYLRATNLFARTKIPYANRLVARAGNYGVFRGQGADVVDDVSMSRQDSKTLSGIYVPKSNRVVPRRADELVRIDKGDAPDAG